MTIKFEDLEDGQFFVERYYGGRKYLRMKHGDKILAISEDKVSAWEPCLDWEPINPQLVTVDFSDILSSYKGRTGEVDMSEMRTGQIALYSHETLVYKSSSNHFTVLSGNSIWGQGHTWIPFFRGAQPIHLELNLEDL